VAVRGNSVLPPVKTSFLAHLELNLSVVLMLRFAWLNKKAADVKFVGTTETMLRSVFIIVIQPQRNFQLT